MNPGKSIAVVLFQLGGPDSLEAIEPFLLRLFRDPDIIDFPFAKIAREPLARIISATRAKKVRNHYAEIGGKSPILEFTQRQARALEDELSRVVKTRVFVAMRYWHPLTEEAVRAVESFAPDELVLLPLYPQYSRTTTGSSLNEWNRQIASSPLRQVPTRIIREFYSDANYLHSLSTQIDKSLSNFPPGEEVHLVFSAHSVPVSVIERGDPYQMQIESTVERLLELGRWRLPHTLCYQSKVGASKWLQPSLHSTLKTLGERSTRNVLVVPVAFVSDHVETLSEINIEAREEAAHHGIHQFELMPGLNDAPGFIRALAGLVLGDAVPLCVKVAEIVGS
jgi:protoporphyrin/coproporphyrin ferrochelatase